MKHFSRTRGWGQQKPQIGTRLIKGDPINDGCVGAWLLGEGGGQLAFDSSGFNNHGTLTNFGASSTSGWNPGKFGNELAFDGTDDQVNLGAGFITGNTYSISVWVFLNAINAYQAIFSKYTGNTDSSEIFVLNANAQLGMGNFASSNCVWNTNTSSIATGVWYHVGLVVTNQVPTGYINGLLNGAVANSGLATISTLTAVAKFGIRNSSFTLNGRIDNSRVWDKRALLPSDMMRLYSDRFAGFVVPRRRVFPSAVAAGGGFKPPRQSLWIPGRGTIIQSSYNQCQI